MPTITDWLMVGITIVYVFATIAICIANFKSASASKKQLEEIKKQYAEMDRPIIEVEFVLERRAFYTLRFVNHGKHTAEHVIIEYDQGFIDSISNVHFRGVLESQKGKECIIGENQHYDMHIGTQELRDNKNIKPAKGLIKYEFNGVVYSSDFYIDIENYMTIFSVTNDEELVVQELKIINTGLNNINTSLLKLNPMDKKSINRID